MERLHSNPTWQSLKALSEEAASIALRYYHQPLEIIYKTDSSPVTEADLAVSQFLEQSLKKIEAIPILSEESCPAPAHAHLDWQRYWLIDPIDGTRQFISKKSDFCICIALIDQHRPVLGAIYSPIHGMFFIAEKGKGAYLYDINQKKSKRLFCNEKQTELNVVISGDKLSESTQRLLSKVPAYKTYCRYSALKILEVALGNAQLSPKFSDTCEWDTAAAHIILQEAGGDIVDMHKKTLTYGTKKSLINPYFLAYGGIHDKLLDNMFKSLHDSH